MIASSFQILFQIEFRFCLLLESDKCSPLRLDHETELK